MELFHQQYDLLAIRILILLALHSDNSIRTVKRSLDYSQTAIRLFNQSPNWFAN
ncbi:hypothetical protein NV377_10345 [Paenibacillus sp. T3-5-0-4]|nr:hypothetical protein [Paenibacillus endoradicis]